MKVSVVVPVYNVAAYIEKCAESLLCQTLHNIEILFIDDCSTDNSVDIIEDTIKKYPDKTKYVRIIRRQTNIGLAGVRLQDINESKGEYIIHCDGDDWVDKDLYERMYLEAVAKDADIVICDEICEYKDHQEMCIIQKLPCFCKDIVRNWYSSCLGMYCHNKMVRKSVYTSNNVLPWVGLNMWEDNGLMTRLMYYGDRLSQVHGTYYHYNRTNISSMTASYDENHIMQMIGIANNLSTFFKAQPDAKDFEETVMAFQFLAKIHFVTDKWSDFKLYKLFFPGSERIMPKLDPMAFSKKGRIRFYMVRYHLSWLFILIFKFHIMVNNLMK